METDPAQDIREEIQDFEETYATFDDFKILDKIGEGTCSSVYLAWDKKHYRHDNSSWCHDHIDLSKRKRFNIPTYKTALEKSSCGFVALKRIYANSSASRIETELRLLKTLGNHPSIANLVGVMREQDQVVAILSYFHHDNFKVIGFI